MFTIYKDLFMSGWGRAINGSYVIVKGTLKRDEFKKVGEVEHLKELRHRFLHRQERHIIAVLPDSKREHAYKQQHSLNRYTREANQDIYKQGD